VTTTAAADPAARRDALAERVGAAILGSLDAQAIYIGDRLGLYRALQDGGPATAPELAARAGIDARYAREWLEHQAVGSVLDVDDVTAEPDERRYTLPEGHEAVLLDPDSLWLMAPAARFVVSFAQRMPDLLEAYRTGDGVDWSNFGADAIEAQEAINRPQFNHLVGSWIEALPDIAARLRDGDARVADVACGTGWSSIAIARHYPAIHVDGIDIDEGSIERARTNAAAQGVDERVTFEHADAAMAAGEGRYALATIFEAVHDMARPAEVLAAVRRLLAPGGALLVGDERVAETFTAPGDEAERMYYGYSILTCLPSGLVDKPSVGTGTVLRPAALEAIAREAGFSGFSVLPIEHEAFRFYRLDP
jgi:2-polyprenyl-3-methyl-5-hydroxy-6-metoxy-1,4-benzoquinol methylase